MEVTGFKVFNGANGLFARPPQHTDGKVDDDGKQIWWDDVRFIGENGQAFRDQVQASIIEAYQDVVGGSASASQPAQQAQSSGGGVTKRPLW